MNRNPPRSSLARRTRRGLVVKRRARVANYTLRWRSTACGSPPAFGEPDNPRSAANLRVCSKADPSLGACSRSASAHSKTGSKAAKVRQDRPRPCFESSRKAPRRSCGPSAENVAAEHGLYLAKPQRTARRKNLQYPFALAILASLREPPLYTPLKRLVCR